MNFCQKKLKLFKRFLFSFFQREEKGRRKRGRQTSMCGCLSCAAPHHPPDLAWNPGMYPDWETNHWPFGSQAGTQSTETHQSGQEIKTFVPQKIVTKKMKAKPQQATDWDKMFANHVSKKDLNPEYTKNCYNSIIVRKTIHRQKIWISISPKRICK